MKELKIEPYYALLTICLLSFYPDNTKISISDYSISFRIPSIYQGIVRWSYGETRKDILYVIHSIKIGLSLLQKNRKDTDLILFNLFTGINKLKLCYILDSQLKLKLEQLEIMVKNMYKDTTYTITEIENRKRFEDLWTMKELSHFNSILKQINDLFILHSVSIQNKINLRKIQLSYLHKFINIKNTFFKQKQLKKYPQLLDKKIKHT
tara:strand:+ start:736 stop:1359 length:624 start_codon:yes stop_codon:yes gene_type:complete